MMSSMGKDDLNLCSSRSRGVASHLTYAPSGCIITYLICANRAVDHDSNPSPSHGCSACEKNPVERD